MEGLERGYTRLTQCSLFGPMMTPNLLKRLPWGLDHVRSELEQTRVQVGRQRKEILTRQRHGIDTASAEMLFQRMAARSKVSSRSGTD